MVSVDRRIRPSDANSSVAELWVGDGDAISRSGVGCGPSSARSLARGDIPPDGISLVNISTRASSKRCGFFSSREIYSGDWPVW